MIVSGVVGDSGRGAEVSTDVGSEGRGAGDTLLEREDGGEVAEGAGEEEEGRRWWLTATKRQPTTGEGEEHKSPQQLQQRQQLRASGVVPNRKRIRIDAEGLRRKNHGEKNE